jgi:LL-diaminopimelate aminotransferase
MGSGDICIYLHSKYRIFGPRKRGAFFLPKTHMKIKSTIKKGAAFSKAPMPSREVRSQAEPGLLIPAARRTSHIREYYFSEKLREIRQLQARGLDVINLGIGSPDLPPAAGVIARLAESCLEPHNHGYQSYRGIPELRHSIAQWYHRYFGVALMADNEVLPLMGSKEGIMHITMAFANPGEEVLVPDPGYPAYQAAAAISGAVARPYDLNPENAWLPDLQALEQQGLKKVKIMWVNYPHMPTGARASKKFFNDLVAFGVRNNILICNDNPYSFILNGEKLSLLSLPGAKKVCLELNSLSKSHNMAGWRIGMLAGAAGYIDAVLKVKSNMDSGMFRPMQLAASQALDAPEQWYHNLDQEYRKRQAMARGILDLLQCSHEAGQAGMFLWGRVPPQFADATSLTDRLLSKAQVFITPGMVFGKNGKRHVRISLCSNVDVLQTARKRIQNHLNEIL